MSQPDHPGEISMPSHAADATTTGGQLRTLLWTKLRMTRHWVASVRDQSKLKVGFVSISAVLLWAGAFFFSLGIFFLFDRFGEQIFGDNGGVNITDVVLNRMLSVMALVIFVMLIVSNVLVSFATLYRAREVAYLIQAPLSPIVFFLGRFVECLSFSSWGLLFLGSPVMVAYGIQREVQPGFYVALLVLFVPFVTIPAAIGSTITMGLVRVFSGLKRPAIVAVALIGVAFLFLFFRGRGANPDLSQAETVQAIVAAMGQTQTPLLPSHWFATAVLQAAVGHINVTAFYALVLLANALMAVLLASVAAHFWFYRGWTSLHAADEQRKPSSVRGGALGFVERLLAPVSEPARSLVIKDLRMFWRDPAQWSQFLIFFGIMALYLANMRQNGGFFGEEPYRSWIAILNMAATMLILATLTTRFVFPLISLEGRRFWILGLAPLRIRSLVRQKFWLSVVLSSLFTVTLGLISGYRLELRPFELFLTLFGIGAATLALSGLAVGLGSLYPNFEEDNPSKITSGMGGTLNFILSLAFIVMVIVGQTFVVQWRRAALESDSDPTLAVAIVLGALTLATLLATLLPLRAGMRNLERTEF